jgi:hypothetical protein
MEIFGFDTGQAWFYENGYHLTSDITRIGKIMAHYELYKRTVDLPGHVVELGVFKGASLVRFATFRDLLESPFSRKIIGFDVFGEFPDPACEIDRKFVAGWKAGAGPCGLSTEEMDAVFSLKGIRNYELVKGDIAESVPKYLAAHPQLRISLLHIDTDIYEPAAAALRHLYGRVVKNGVIVLDDYGVEHGGTRAVDEFFQDKEVLIKKLPFSHASPAYIVKG